MKFAPAVISLSIYRCGRYKLKGCWGNPPRNYQEILERQEAELAILRKRYTVY